jgi:hypothetical protein
MPGATPPNGATRARRLASALTLSVSHELIDEALALRSQSAQTLRLASQARATRSTGSAPGGSPKRTAP